MTWHWHRWGLWGEVKSGADRYGNRVPFQERTCSVCNIVKRRFPGPNSD